MATRSRPVLRLVRERKLAELIPPPKGGGVLEASGVFAKGRDRQSIHVFRLPGAR